MYNILITGTDGFIGKKLKEGLSNDFNIISINRSNGYDMRSPLKIETNKKIDFFIHTAFQIKSDKFKVDEYNELNYEGVVNSLNFCRINNIKYIFLSSYVYGSPIYLPIDINHPTNPHNNYAKIKLRCEKLCKQYSDRFRLNSLILRLFNIYGDGQKEGYVFSDILKQIENNKVYIKNINSKRDYLHVNDLVVLVKKIILLNFNEYKILNVGSGKSTSIKEIVKTFIKLKNGLKFSETQSVSKDIIKDCYADIKDLLNIYNWQPKISIEEGIKKLLTNE